MPWYCDCRQLNIAKQRYVNPHNRRDEDWAFNREETTVDANECCTYCGYYATWHAEALVRGKSKVILAEHQEARLERARNAQALRKLKKMFGTTRGY